MREGPDVLVNALAGERVIFRKHAADTGGQLIQFDLVLTKVGGNPPPHIHLHQTERFVVGSGALRVMVADEERELREGEDAPGLRFEELLDEAFRLVDEGKFGEQGPIDQAATSAWAEKWHQSTGSSRSPVPVTPRPSRPRRPATVHVDVFRRASGASVR